MQLNLRNIRIDDMIWIIIGIVVVFLDQLTKWLAVIYLEGGESVYLIDGVLRFTYLENRGAAFGMLSEHRWVFLVISTVAIIAIIFYMIKFKPQSKIMLPHKLNLAGVTITAMESPGIMKKH